MASKVEDMILDYVLPDISCSNFPIHMMQRLLTHEFAK